MGRIANDDVVKDSDINYNPNLSYVDVQCFPLYSYLLALNVTVVDYFSLDVEGSELNVLKTIPFDKIDIKVSSVYFNLCNDPLIILLSLNYYYYSYNINIFVFCDYFWFH